MVETRRLRLAPVFVLSPSGDRHEQHAGPHAAARIGARRRSRSSPACRCRAARPAVGTRPRSPGLRDPSRPCARRVPPSGAASPSRRRCRGCRRRPARAAACRRATRAPARPVGGRSRAAGASGRVTTNSLPLPRPRLRASIAPPCSATRPRVSDRPMPRPPSERSSADVACENISNSCGSSSGAIPMPLSCTLITASVARHSCLHADQAARIGVLRRVGQQIREDLREAHRIGIDGDRRRREIDDEPVSARLDQRPRGVDRCGEAVLRGRGAPCAAPACRA